MLFRTPARRSLWDVGFGLFFRAFPAGLLGGALMIAYAMAAQHAARHDVWILLTSIAGTFLGDDAVESATDHTQAVILGAGIHATNAVLFAVFFALILTSRHAFTLPTVFRAFLGFQGAQYGEACALATTSLVPSLILGMLVQRHLVRGLTLGAIRG